MEPTPSRVVSDLHPGQGTDNSLFMEGLAAGMEPDSIVSASPSRSERSRSKKRKRESKADGDLSFQVSRRKRNYNSKYHALLNEAIDDLHFDPSRADKADLQSSQVDIARWSPQEKEMFYRGLVRYGRDNLPAITALVTTKSELEIRAYLKSLQAASVKTAFYGNSATRLLDMPAAFEISNECCDALEQAADSLAFLQRTHEELRERQRHAYLWRLDQRTDQWVNRRLSKVDGVNELREKLPAAEILNLNSFLELSTALFMNSSDPDGNYRSFVSRNEKPSILCTAFSDLYQVALSVTKRIIQASLYCTASRLKATQSLGYLHNQAVKRADVSAALKILGMKDKANDFWATVPRRCKLAVYSHPKHADSDEPLSFDQVEFLLSSGPSALGMQSTPDSAGECENYQTATVHGSTSAADSDPITSSSFHIEEQSEKVSSQDSAIIDLSERESNSEQREEAYHEDFDHRTSRHDELGLWKTLEKTPPLTLVSEESKPKPNYPERYRQSKHDPADWREWTISKPKWEAYDLESLDQDLIENRRRMQVRLSTLASSFSQTYHTGSPQARDRIRKSKPRTSSWRGATTMDDQIHVGQDFDSQLETDGDQGSTSHDEAFELEILSDDDSSEEEGLGDVGF